MTLARIVQHLAECPGDLEGEFVEAQETEPEPIAVVLAAIRRCRADLAEFADEVEKALLAVMGEKNLEVPGVGLVEVKKATRRTQWQHDDLLAAVVARLADEPGVFFDPEDGVFLPSQTIGHNIARRLRECVSFGAGKVTGLRALGIDPSEYCTEDEGRYAIKMPGPAL